MAKHKDKSGSTDKQELIELENRYWQALQDKTARRQRG
jgi:hypothetical protein